MKTITLDQLKDLALAAKASIWADARSLGREPKIYLHWTAGRYAQDYDDYHVCIHGDGTIVATTADFSDVLAHTWHRNTGSVGITLDCAYGSTSNDLGPYPPTAKQIEAMAQCITVVADALDLTIDRYRVMTHAEAADNIDGLLPRGDEYGPLNGCERWDLQYLGTPESPSWTTDYDDPHTGGNVLRGKANWYRNEWRK